MSSPFLSNERPLIMGVVNYTPDSFYDGGVHFSPSAVLQHIQHLLKAGADILDIGSYSTRPGGASISKEEEWDRISKVLHLIKEHSIHKQVTISVDTFRSTIVKQAAQIIPSFIVNDISGGTIDHALFDTVATTHQPYILTFLRGELEEIGNPTHSEDIVKEAKRFYANKIELLLKKGVTNIILDLGFGFGKSMADNYKLLSHQKTFAHFGYPILTGVSRKSMIWKLLETTPSGALNGSTALHMYALIQGANILRVHDVKEAVEVRKIWMQLQSP